MFQRVSIQYRIDKDKAKELPVEERLQKIEDAIVELQRIAEQLGDSGNFKERMRDALRSSGVNMGL
jgi:hypothetical protein